MLHVSPWPHEKQIETPWAETAPPELGLVGPEERPRLLDRELRHPAGDARDGTQLSRQAPIDFSEPCPVSGSARGEVFDPSREAGAEREGLG